MLPRTRLLAAVAALGLFTALGPAAQAVSAPVANPAGVSNVAMWSTPPYKKTPVIRAVCPSAKDLRRPGAEYRVKDTGIHIRATPAGKMEWGVGKGSHFISDWIVRNVSGYQCVVTVGGKQWLLGADADNYTHHGWVRMDYLTLVKYFLPDTFKK